MIVKYLNPTCIDDSRASCCINNRNSSDYQWTREYIEGKHEPHYPVPATMPVSIKANGLYFYLVYRYRLWGKQGFR